MYKLIFVLGVFFTINLYSVEHASASNSIEHASASNSSNEIPLTILHTNDLHSHYQPSKDEFGLGGVARLAAAIRQARASVTNSILLDGGDWSEGSIYYNLGTGRTALELMQELGYDAAVVGNHDWLNGPDQLLSILNQVNLDTKILAANLDFSKYKKGKELQKHLLPHTILNVGQLKIGVIGLVTYELIYDKWLKPVQILDPFSICNKISKKLKEQGADLVIVISHNGLTINKLIAGLGAVDIVIHAHDHLKLQEPIEIKHNGKIALIVEASRWGAFLGKLDLIVDKTKRAFKLKRYELIQIDHTITPDAKVESMVLNYDKQLMQKYGNIFQDHLADLQVSLRRHNFSSVGGNLSESLFGNFLTDAYREITNADVAFEQVKLTSDELYKGPINSVDIFNALTAVYNPILDKTWTLKTLDITGKSLYFLLNNIILNLQSVLPISASGLYVVYDPFVAQKWTKTHGTMSDLRSSIKKTKSPNVIQLPEDVHATESNANPIQYDHQYSIKYIEVGGKPIDFKKTYRVAMSQGGIETLDFLNLLDGFTNFKDTGIERWKVLAQYLIKHTPIDSSKILRGKRFTVLNSDLALYHDDVVIKTLASTLDKPLAPKLDKTLASTLQASITIHNFGASPSSARKLFVSYDKTPTYYADDPNPEYNQAEYPIPPIKHGGTYKLTLDLKLPKKFMGQKVPIYFILDESSSDPNRTNDGTWVVTLLR